MSIGRLKPVFALVSHSGAHPRMLQELDHMWVRPGASPVGMLMQEVPSTTQLFNIDPDHKVQVETALLKNDINPLLVHLREVQALQTGKGGARGGTNDPCGSASTNQPQCQTAI